MSLKLSRKKRLERAAERAQSASVGAPRNYLTKPTKPPTWRPGRIGPAGISFAGLAPPGHLVVGVLINTDGTNPLEKLWTRGIALPATARAFSVLLAEVLDVGDGCPGLRVGDRVLIQRFSGLAGVDPDRLSRFVPTGTLDRFSALQVVRCGNGIRAQDSGNGEKLVKTAFVVAMLRQIVKAGKGTIDDPKMLGPKMELRGAERLLVEILRRREGKAVDGAILAAGLQTGDDGAVFDGVVAVVDG